VETAAVPAKAEMAAVPARAEMVSQKAVPDPARAETAAEAGPVRAAPAEAKTDINHN
jgi:hypothetical protein